MPAFLTGLSTCDRGARSREADASIKSGSMNVFADFQSRIASLLKKRIAAGELPVNLDLGRFVVEPPREAAHGDLSTNAAMVYAKAARSNPRTLAVDLAYDIAQEPDVANAEVAGPGF